MTDDQLGRLLEELKRIRLSAWLAAALFLLLAFLDGPVTTLGWMLLGSGILSLLYIAAASTLSLIRDHPHNQ